MIRSCLAGLVAASFLLLAPPVDGQVAEQDWTERPDRFAPAGSFADRVLPPGTLEVRATWQTRSQETLFQGRNEIPRQLVLGDWTTVPLNRTVHQANIDVAAGVLPWLGLAARIPYIRNEAEFSTLNRSSSVVNADLGDVEVHALASLHDTWPVRAHASLGVGIPTGSADATGELPDRPDEDRVLPYQLQAGSGALFLIPGAYIAVENEYGTVGLQASGRIWLEDNDREWRPGNSFNLQGHGQYRLNDWLSASLRVNFLRWDDVSGMDPGLDAQRSPMDWPFATGGTRVDLPVGMNILFREGSLAGHLLQAEVIVPAHTDMNGPQLGAGWGANVSWSRRF